MTTEQILAELQKRKDCQATDNSTLVLGSIGNDTRDSLATDMILERRQHSNANY